MTSQSTKQLQTNERNFSIELPQIGAYVRQPISISTKRSEERKKNHVFEQSQRKICNLFSASDERHDRKENESEMNGTQTPTKHNSFCSFRLHFELTVVDLPVQTMHELKFTFISVSKSVQDARSLHRFLQRHKIRNKKKVNEKSINKTLNFRLNCFCVNFSFCVCFCSAFFIVRQCLLSKMKI